MNDQEIAALIRPLDDIEREHILDALRLAGGNKVAAAKGLGISLKTLYNKLNRYEMAASPIGGLR